MPTRIVEWKLPYTWGTGIGIDTNKVISLLLREENNLIHVNDDNEVYTDLQLVANITPSSEFPVWVTVGKVLQTDWWTQNGLILNWKTTSGDYARWLYWADGELYFDWGQGTWKQVYYSDEVLALFTQLRGELATVAFSGDYNDLINRPAFLQEQADWDQTDTDAPDYIKNKPTIPTVNDATLTIQKNWAAVGTFTANASTNTSVNITVPNVINNVTSTSTSDALSANQGKVLQDQIDDLKAMGRFLSLWDCETGMPISFPLATPYNYQTWDYFLVENVDTTTNYRPNGVQYTGTASTTVETDEVEVWDLYIYDWAVWLLQINHGKSVSFANLAGQPSDNTALATALNLKADAVDVNTKTFHVDSWWTTEAQEAYDWHMAWNTAIVEYWGTLYYYISTSSNNLYFEAVEPTRETVANEYTRLKYAQVILNVSWSTVTSVTVWTYRTTGIQYLSTNLNDVASYTSPYIPTSDWAPATKKYVDDNTVTKTSELTNDSWFITSAYHDSSKQDTLSAGTGISITNNEVANTWVTSFNGSTWAVTYTAPVTSVNGQTWAVTVDAGDAKVFTITGTTGSTNLTAATQAYTYAYTTGKCAIIRYSNANYVYAYGSTTVAYFTRAYGYWAVSSGTWASMSTLKLTVSSWSVTAIGSYTNTINVSSSAPSSSTSNGVITLVI